MRGFIIFLTFALWVESSYALTVRTQDMQFVNYLVIGIKLYEKEHGGASPDKWSDLDSYFDGGVAQVAKYVQGKERYALLSPPISFSEPFEGELIIVSRRAFNDVSHYLERSGKLGLEIGPLGHYAVVRTQRGDIEQHWFTEDEMAKVYTSAGVPKVAADSLPERDSVVRLRRKLVINNVFAFGSGTLLLLLALRWFVKRAKHNSAAQTTSLPSSGL